MKRNRNYFFFLLFLPLLCFGDEPSWQGPILAKIVAPFRSWMEQGQGDHFVFMVSETAWSNVIIVSDPDHYEIRDPSWFFYRLHDDEWVPVRRSESADAYFSTKRISFFWLTESNVRRPVIYTRLFSPVTSNGVYRTWAEYEKGIDDIVVTNELLQAICVDTNGIPHIETMPGNFIPRLWSDSFQILEKMNFDIYSGTNLAHSTLIPDYTGPVPQYLTEAEKTAFATWFRASAATNGPPSTNAVLAVFSDDDEDGRTDAFATIADNPDADGAYCWTFCKNAEDGWQFAAGFAHEVTARTNEFFRYHPRTYHPNGYVHEIVVVRPDPQNPLWPLLPRYSDEREKCPPGVSLRNWHRRDGHFLRDYQELMDESCFRKLEHLIAESLP